jgi:hypothetical protein
MPLLEPKRQTGGIARSPGNGHKPDNDESASWYFKTTIHQCVSMSKLGHGRR